MVWAVEEMVVHVRLDCGVECVRVPVRAKFEFEVQDGLFVQDTLSFDILYNRKLLEKRYPQLDFTRVEMAIRETVQTTILKHIKRSEGTISVEIYQTKS